MTSKILLLMPICINPTNADSVKGEERINQYINGLNKVFEYLEILNKYNVDIIIFDNTIKKDNTLPIQITNVIPSCVKIINDDVNNYGRLNKGAGLIECWKYCTTFLKEYDFLIHFEPRQLLLNFNFIQNFLDNPRNLFTYGEDRQHFNTGLFCIKCEILIPFVHIINLDVMSSNSICIEYILFDFFKNNNIPSFVADKMELTWFPNAHNPINW